MRELPQEQKGILLTPFMKHKGHFVNFLPVFDSLGILTICTDIFQPQD